MANLWAYNDPKGWGRAFKDAAPDAVLFKSSDEVPAGSRCFVRLDQQGAQREISRELVKELHGKDCVTLPTMQEARWYDDKAAQISALKPWLPTTHHIDDAKTAYRIAMSMQYPFISKAVDGSSSKTVRVVNSMSDAIAEINAVFSKDGIESVYDRRQRGYLYWQQLVSGNACDYRVIIIGDTAHGLLRYNKEGTIFASGSGHNRPLAPCLSCSSTDKERIAMKTAFAISDQIGSEWMAYDFVFSGNRPYVLEMSSAWTVKAYHRCRLYDRRLRQTTKSGRDIFKLAAKILRGGSYGHIHR